ncbi:MAG: hypothetical protein JOZ54_16250 [Acidobacteria bacterium]|nr:hypothetical protein [Acidobacteriota bacterium]
MFRRWPLIYVAWIALCAVLFIALRNADDPSRRSDRIQSNEAGRRAIAILTQQDAARYRNYEPVHVAYANANEGAPERRWVVLCDAVPHTGRGVVVELGAADGRLLRIRPPVAD